MSRCEVPTQTNICKTCSLASVGTPCSDAPLLWHAQPPPEDDPHQESRWSHDEDRQAFYTLYQKLLSKR